MRKKILLSILPIAICICTYYLNNKDLTILKISKINIESEANINPPKPDHGRPLLYAPDYGYKCGSCSGDDCGAAC